MSSRVNDLSAVSVVSRGEKLIEALFYSGCAAFLIIFHFIVFYLLIYLFSLAKTKNRFFLWAARYKRYIFVL